MKRTFPEHYIFIIKLAKIFLKYNFFSDEKECGIENDILTDVFSCLTAQGKEKLFEMYKYLVKKKRKSERFSKGSLYPVDECHLFLTRDNEGNISCVTKD